MKIAYFVQDFPPEVGAGPARVLETARVWMEEGVDVTVLTGMPNRRLPGREDGIVHPDYRGRLFMEEYVEGIRVLRSWLFTSPKSGVKTTVLNNASFMLTSAINGLFRLRSPDVVIASSPPFLVHPAGWVTAALKRVPLVLEIRDLWPDYMKDLGMIRSRLVERILFGMERRLLHSASRVVTVTESFKDRVIEKGTPEDRVFVIPNGVDLGRYFPDPDADFPFSYERRNGEVVAGYLGTFGRGQGLETLVDTGQLLESSSAHCRILLVGDGPQRDAVMERLDSTGTGNVDVRPPVSREDTLSIYNACDVCLVPLADVPAFQDTIPSKLFEIMACGRPIIAMAEGETARIIHESGAGWSCAPGDYRALSELLVQFSSMEEHERRKIGERGREYVRSRYNRRQLALEYLEQLRTLVGESA